MSPTSSIGTSTVQNLPAPRTGCGQITFLGAGPGDPGLLTLRAVEVLGSADVLVADPLTAEAVRAHCRENVELHGADLAETFVLDDDAVLGDGAVTSVDTVSRFFAAVKSGKHVVRTVDGDPGLDGRAAEEMLACARAGVPFEVVPGIAQSVGVPAYAGVPLRTSAPTT